MIVAMPLITPDEARYEEWVELIADFGGPDCEDLDGSGFHANREPVRPTLTRDGFAEWMAVLREEGDESAVSPPGRVKCSYFWITDDDGAWVGFLALRRTLNEFLAELGGHIGYSVRPSRRREGHAARALHDALPEAAALGIDRVLVTCDEDNVGSARTIEANGGVYEDSRQGKRRYWIPTS